MKKKRAETTTVKKPFYRKIWFWILVVIILIFALPSKTPSTASSSSASVSSSPSVASSSSSISSSQPTSESSVSSVSSSVSTDSSSSEDPAVSQSSALDEISFAVNPVRNDVTGNWRISLIADNIDLTDYALEYYQKYFTDDKEIHFIVNFNYNTTTKISVIGGQLDVTVQDYVSKEEHDAKILGSGTVLAEYFVDKTTGEIEKIR